MGLCHTAHTFFVIYGVSTYKREGVQLDSVEKAIELIKQGSLEEYRHIVQGYQQPLFKYCWHMLGSVEEAEDAVQEVFIKAYRKLGSYRADTSFSSWLYRIAYNHCIDCLRKRKYFQFVPLLDNTASDYDTTAYTVEKDELSLLLQKAISMLPPEDKTVLMLRVLEEKSYDEIAEILGKRSCTVRKKYERAKKKVKQNIDAMKGVIVNEKYAVN
jgi:RNA polymerase sigma-70 factor (ECF subfamily)